jgi:excisionase family DNA binding protein
MSFPNEPYRPPNKDQLPAQPLAVGIARAAEMLGVCRNSIYSLLRTGQLRAVGIGRRRIIPVADLQDFLRRQGAADLNQPPKAAIAARRKRATEARR